MDIRLFTIESVPKTLPVWETILDDLGRPPAYRIARTLGVGLSTVYRWNKTGDVPKMACLALFWLTRWGRSEVDCRATNDAMAAVALARSLNEQRAELRGQLAQAENDRDRLASMVERFTALARETSGRGNAAIAAQTHTGNHFGGSWGAGWSLAWQAPPPRVVGTVGCPEPTPGLPPELAALSRLAGQGSPSATQPEAHSVRCQGVGRSAPLPPSIHQEVLPSLPSSQPGEWCQSDAIMAPPDAPGLRDLLELRQAPRPGAGLVSVLTSLGDRVHRVAP